MKKISKSMQQELTALALMSDSEIDFTDIPPTQENDWLGAERAKFYRPVKQQLTVRIDSDILDWLKSQGKGYQSRLNEILRSAMLEKTH